MLPCLTYPVLSKYRDRLHPPSILGRSRVSISSNFRTAFAWIADRRALKTNSPLLLSSLSVTTQPDTPTNTAVTDSLSEQAEVSESTPDLIDVKDLISRYDVAEHARLADAYFNDFSLEDAQFRKPFMTFETPELLTKLGVITHNLAYFPGMRILDFGCGTGWLTHSLAQMGCLAIGIDVSANAVSLAERYVSRTFPALKASATYKLFDGITIPLDTSSVDRVVCFDSFHHVPNQQRVLEEFSRVLTHDGIAVFCEPGPCHSHDPMAQHEMRTFGVIENDIVVEDIWELASRAGFKKIEISIFGIRPLLTSLEEFSSLSTFDDGAEVIRQYYETAVKPVYDGLRFFVLRKDPVVADSRIRDGLRCDLRVDVCVGSAEIRFTGIAKNTGTSVWLPSGDKPGSVNLGMIRKVRDGSWEQDFQRVYLLSDQLSPGEEVRFSCTLRNEQVKGSEIYFDLVAEHVAWFNTEASSLVKVY